MDFQSLRQLMISNRTVRRFKEDKTVSKDTLKKIIELTRYCPSGRNVQSLRYVIVTDQDKREQIFPLLKWAAYLKDWDGPKVGERPSAYIIQCLDTEYGPDCLCDDGLQLEAITLGMHSLGLAGCIIKSFNHAKMAEVLDIDKRYIPRYVVALGYPAETVVIDDMSDDDDADFKYYRTSDGTHHVPKRPLSSLIL